MLSEKVKELLYSRHAFVSSVALPALSKFGLESLEWDPLALRDAFQEEFSLGEMPQRTFDKLNTGYMLVGTTAFETTIEGFLTGTAVLNGLVLDTSAPPFVDIEQCSWALWEYGCLMADAPEENVSVFCPEIVEYIRQVGNLNGMTRFPAHMSFADSDIMAPIEGDIHQFEMYERRQDGYIDMLNARIEEKQTALAEQLKVLEDAGLVGARNDAADTATTKP
jgi:hypothetical protein